MAVSHHVQGGDEAYQREPAGEKRAQLRLRRPSSPEGVTVVLGLLGLARRATRMWVSHVNAAICMLRCALIQLLPMRRLAPATMTAIGINTPNAMYLRTCAPDGASAWEYSCACSLLPPNLSEERSVFRGRCGSRRPAANAAQR